MSQAARPKLVKLPLAEIERHCDLLAAEHAERSQETAGTYKRALTEFKRYYARDRHFFFRRSDVERYRAYLADQRQFKNASIATYMTALRKLVQKLLDSSLLEDNSALEVVGGRRPQAHKRTFLQPKDIRQLLQSVSGTSPADLRDNAIIRLMLSCAVAEQELVVADLGDLVHDGKVTRLRVRGKGRSAKDGLVTVPAATLQALERYLEARGLQGENPADYADEPLLLSFSGRSKGQRLSKRGLRQLLNARLNDSGVKRARDRVLTPFSLRHTCGVLLVRAGCTEAEIMQIMRIEWLYTARQYVTAANMMDCSAQAARQFLGWGKSASADMQDENNSSTH